MRKIFSLFTIFSIGAVCYSAVEILFRGFTHWTMSLTGGTIFLVLFSIQSNLRQLSLVKKCLLGTAIITSFEFTVGVIVNIILRWHIWDYSKMPFNILGQICLPFTFLWFLICIPAYFLCFSIKKFFK